MSSWFAADFHDGSHKGAQAVPNWLGLGWSDFMLPSLIALVSSGLGGWWVWRREAVYAAR